MRALLLLLVMIAPVAAQTAVEKARVSYQAGVTAFRAQDYSAALGHFERAYKLDPSPVLIYNLARAHEEMGHGARAIEHYELYLDRQPDAADRADVERRIRVMRAILDREQAAVPPPERGPDLMPWAWAATGLGVVGVSAGIGFGVATSNAETEHADATTGARKRSTADDAESLSTWANVSYGLGALLLVTGVTLWVLDPGGDVAISPTPGGAAVVGRF